MNMQWGEWPFSCWIQYISGQAMHLCFHENLRAWIHNPCVRLCLACHWFFCIARCTMTTDSIVLHPSLTFWYWCAHCCMYPLLKKTKVVYGNYSKRLYCFEHYQGTCSGPLCFRSYGFINGAVIYAHVCILVCLSFVNPNLHSHQQMLPFLVQGSNVQAEKCLIIIKLYREGKVK